MKEKQRAKKKEKKDEYMSIPTTVSGSTKKNNLPQFSLYI